MATRVVAVDVPTWQQHLLNAENNQRLALALQTGPHVDWSVTTPFYAALHLVEAMLVPAIHSPNHSARNQIVQSDPRLWPKYRHYCELYVRSLDARYDCVAFSTLQAQHLYVTRYEPIKRHLRPLPGFAF